MDTIPDFNGDIYYISRIFYRYNAINDSGYTADLTGQLTLNELPESEYVPYSAITENDVITWLDTYTDVTSLRSQLDNKLNSKMATTYRWYINEMDTYLSYSGYSYFVTKVSWRYNATNDSGYSANIMGQSTYNVVNDTVDHPYVQYSALTENEVINWLDSGEDIITIREQLDNNLIEQMNPPIVSLPLPWR